MEKLILMDGTVIENGTAGYDQGFLWCYLRGYTITQAAQIFFDPSKTGKIIFQYGEMSDEYDGFTNCTAILIDADGVVSVCLEGGHPVV